jgi:hypothetical protein
MVARCTDPNRLDWKYYGGRGIEVCPEWKHPENFCNTMLSGYAEGLELDRIDNDGNYSPENCRWSTHRDNGRNRSTCVLPKHIIETAERNNIRRRTLYARVRRGSTLERACVEPILPRVLSPEAIRKAAANGISSRRLYERVVKLEWSLEKACTEPLRNTGPRPKIPVRLGAA